MNVLYYVIFLLVMKQIFKELELQSLKMQVFNFVLIFPLRYFNVESRNRRFCWCGYTGKRDKKSRKWPSPHPISGYWIKIKSDTEWWGHAQLSSPSQVLSCPKLSIIDRFLRLFCQIDKCEITFKEINFPLLGVLSFCLYEIPRENIVWLVFIISVFW